MALHSNESVFFGSLPPRMTVAVVVVNHTACAGDCVPEGFWTLVVTSISVLCVLMLLLIWAASPRQCCICCGRMGRGFREIWKESGQRLLPGSRRRARGGGDNDDDDEGDTELEDWWELKPQTDKEKELVQRRKEQEEERERHRREMESGEPPPHPPKRDEEKTD